MFMYFEILGNVTYSMSWNIFINMGSSSISGSATFNNVTENPNVAPVIASADTASGTTGAPFSYQIAAINSPTAFNATGLPSDLSVNTTTGLITGTPSATGVWTIALSATNSHGTGTATLALTVNPPAPVITSATTVTGTAGSTFSYQIAASNAPTSYTATNLPDGLSVNATTGAITGTPQFPGFWKAPISATNAGGTATATLSLTIAPIPPVITSPLTATATVGVSFTYYILVANTATSITATGLPAGLTENTTSGIISGTPTATGVSTITLTATNSAGTDTKTLTLTVNAMPALPVITSPITATATAGAAFSYQINASNSPTAYSATGMPVFGGSNGLSINTVSGLITGTPNIAGVYPFTIGATNAAGTGTATVTLTVVLPVTPAAPAASSGGGGGSKCALGGGLALVAMALMAFSRSRWSRR